MIDLQAYGNRFGVEYTDALRIITLHGLLSPNFAAAVQDLDKKESAADKKLESVNAQLVQTKTQLSAAEMSLTRVQAELERTQINLEAAEGAISLISFHKSTTRALPRQAKLLTSDSNTSPYIDMYEYVHSSKQYSSAGRRWGVSW